ncbi:MAG: CHASE2 domain-containing protein [Cyanobacteria bacterium]|nr:CHASE2 domain-containing protein [Cyanobacteriota bacterium]
MNSFRLTLSASKLTGFFKIVMPTIRRWVAVKNGRFKNGLGSALLVTLLVLVIRSLSMLEGSEFRMLDQFFRMRGDEPLDSRIVIVDIDENDLNQIGRWPISDQQLVDILTQIQEMKPTAIGLDLYRDIPLSPGTSQLQKFLETNANIIGIEQLADQSGSQVAPPPVLEKAKRVGFNNIILDSDQRVRRSFLYWKSNRGNYIRESFSLKLAKLYLSKEKIYEQPSPYHVSDLKLGRGIFRQFQRNDGPYINADAGAYQVMVNFRGLNRRFQTLMLQDLMGGDVPAQILQDKIVLIGTTATSLHDFFATPYTHHRFGGATSLMSGMELQAQFTSQILSAALDGRALLQVWSEPLEVAWIALWAAMGVFVCMRFRGPKRSLVLVVILGAIVLVIGYAAFLMGWIIPVVAPLAALITAFALITSRVAQSKEKLEQSKDFLHQILNTIPDPVFVQDRSHRWVVVNQAYGRFIGMDIEALIGKTVYDIFSKREADAFYQADEEVLRQQQKQEYEETLTDVLGKTYSIATKRSLHRDAQGNVLLVGVIRDITIRKSLEESLRRTTQELSKSNQELRDSQTQLHYLANHDPLTGLPNRQLFHENLQQSIEWAASESRMVALLFIDLDGFKQVNDSFGHGVGDQLLKSVAKRLISSLRASDMVARLGGDEFTVILTVVPGELEVMRVAQKMIETLALPYNFDGQLVRVSASVGIALYPTHYDTVQGLLQGADGAMYEAKAAGKNRYAIVNPSSLPSNDPVY